LELVNNFHQVANNVPMILKIIALVCFRFYSNHAIKHTECVSRILVFKEKKKKREWEKRMVDLLYATVCCV